jgi:hypothetical protein
MSNTTAGVVTQTDGVGLEALNFAVDGEVFSPTSYLQWIDGGLWQAWQGERGTVRWERVPALGR